MKRLTKVRQLRADALAQCLWAQGLRLLSIGEAGKQIEVDDPSGITICSPDAADYIMKRTVPLQRVISSTSMPR
jgi:hypothetical protein